jgi:CHAT domain-containing protein
VTVEQIQHTLDDEQSMLLRFSLGSPHSYLWLVTRRSLEAVKLPDVSEIDAAARQVHALVQQPREAEGAERWRGAARGLGSMLLADVANRLATRRLLVVPEGSLQLVPFAALTEPGTDSPLITRHEIVMLPSASTLAVLRRQHEGRVPASKALAVVADPVYDPADPRIPPALRTSDRRASGAERDLRLGRLRFSGIEARWITSAVTDSPAFVATGFAATPATMLTALRDYRVVHIAAHAMLDDERPELSALALSLFDESGRARHDGMLRFFDIQERLRLRADLVVVSACETALGKEVPGEALMSLARGFFAAGSARVVASVYSVPDAATAELMREFYRGMFGSQRLRPAAALRAAQLRLRETPQWQDPYYWSGFVLLGEPN